MSVIVKNHTNGKVYLLVQGSADSINEITNCYKTGSTNSIGSLHSLNSYYSSYGVQMNQLASLGLRIIGLAYKDIDEDEVNTSIKILEEGAQMIGFAALEDKLREGVTETIENLRKAGIKLWMLTGDSFHTSCNVSYASHLIANDGPFILLSNDKERLGLATQSNCESQSQERPSKFSFHSNSTHEINVNSNENSNKKIHSRSQFNLHPKINSNTNSKNLNSLDFESINNINSDNYYNTGDYNNDFDDENPYFINMKYVLDQVEYYVDNQISTSNGVFYLGVDGCYKELLSDEHKEQFTRIAMKAKSVVCSRVSPNDKAEIVKCVNSKIV